MEIEDLEAEEDKYRSRAKKVGAKINRLEIKLEQFQNECPHNTLIEDDGYRVCERCDCEIGRLCPTSPSGMCEFGEEPIGGGLAVCKFCGKEEDEDEEDDDEDDEEDDGVV